MVRSVLKYGYAKAKFTENAICRQILVVQAAQAVKAAVLKGQQHSADAVMKEAENVVANAEAVTVVVETQVDKAAIAEAVAPVVVTVRVDKVAQIVVAVVIVQAAQEEDSK